MSISPKANGLLTDLLPLRVLDLYLDLQTPPAPRSDALIPSLKKKKASDSEFPESKSEETAGRTNEKTIEDSHVGWTRAK